MSHSPDALVPGRPYLAATTAGVQSPLPRYLMMPTVVHALKATQPVSVLEVGTWIGASMLVWAEAIERFCPQKGAVLCVDTWDPYFGTDPAEARVENDSYARMTHLAESGEAYRLFLHNARCAPASVPIRHFRGASGDVLPTLADRSFDIVYLDGNHAYEHVRVDVAQSLRLVRDGGFICGDDLELQWHEVDQALTIRHGNTDSILNAAGVAYHPGVTRAVGEELGPVPSYFGFWAVQKVGDKLNHVDLRASATFVPTHLAEQYAASDLHKRS